MSAKPARKSIAIVVPPSAQSLDVSGPLDAFLEAIRQSSGRVHYDVRLVAIEARRTIRAGGMSLIADSSIFDDSKAIAIHFSLPERRTSHSLIRAEIFTPGCAAAHRRHGDTARYAPGRFFSAPQACLTD
jgi:hypothetical protein